MPDVTEPLAQEVIENLLAKALTMVSVDGLPSTARPGPTTMKVTNFPGMIDVPTITTKTYRVDGVMKGVVFGDHGWPSNGNSITNTLPIKGLPTGLLDGSANNIAGTIGSFELQIPTPTSEGLAVTVEATWTLVGPDGSVGVSVSPGAGLSTKLSVVPPVVDWPSTTPNAPTTWQLTVEVTAKATVVDPNGDTHKDKVIAAPDPVKLGPFPILVAEVPIPTVLALFEFSNFGGMVLLVVPEGSPLAHLEGKAGEIAAALDSVVSKLTAVAYLPPFGQIVSGLEHLRNLLRLTTRPPKLVVGNVHDLDSILMRSTPNPPWGDIRTTAAKLFESMIYISGSPTKEVQLFNRAGHTGAGGGVYDGGAFKVAAGHDRVVAVPSLIEDRSGAWPILALRPGDDGHATVTHKSERFHFSKQLKSIKWL